MTREEMIKDLIEELGNWSDLYIGKYDARNGKDSFMYGILSVMECLASEVSEEYADEFNRMFLQNMVDSQNKV